MLEGGSRDIRSTRHSSSRTKGKKAIGRRRRRQGQEEETYSREKERRCLARAAVCTVRVVTRQRKYWCCCWCSACKRLKPRRSQGCCSLLLNLSTLNPTVGTISVFLWSSGLKWLRTVDLPELSSPTTKTLHSFFRKPRALASLSKRPITLERQFSWRYVTNL